MPTETLVATAPVLDSCTLLALDYLEKNDFTSVRHVGHHLLAADDGDREVYIWVTIGRPVSTGRLLVPAHLYRIASPTRARVDVISVYTKGDRVVLRHLMNT